VSAKLQTAKAMIKEASAKWPGLKNYLNATGLGTTKTMIVARTGQPCSKLPHPSRGEGSKPPR
jgi:hypothetical protein